MDEQDILKYFINDVHKYFRMDEKRFRNLITFVEQVRFEFAEGEAIAIGHVDRKPFYYLSRYGSIQADEWGFITL